MGRSIYLARVMGLYLVITGIYVLFNYQHFDVIFASMLKDKGLLLLLALITLIIGLLLVVAHNIWERSWRVVITVMSWLILLTGLFRLFFMEYMMKAGTWWLEHKAVCLAVMLLFFAVGLFLLYKGYWGAEVGGK